MSKYDLKYIKYKKERITTEVIRDAKEVLDLAKAKGFSLDEGDLQTQSAIHYKMRAAFPFTAIIQSENDWDIANVYAHPEYHIRAYLHIKNYNAKNRILQVTNYHIHYFQTVQRLFGFSENFGTDIKKSFANGRTDINIHPVDVIKLTSITNHVNDDTKAILSRITEADRLKYQEYLRKDHYNLYGFVHELRDRYAPKARFFNHDCIIFHLSA